MISTDMGWLEKRTNFWDHIKGQRLIVMLLQRFSCAGMLARDCSATAERGQIADIYTVNLVICGRPRRWLHILSSVKRCDVVKNKDAVLVRVLEDLPSESELLICRYHLGNDQLQHEHDHSSPNFFRGNLLQ